MIRVQYPIIQAPQRINEWLVEIQSPSLIENISSSFQIVFMEVVLLEKEAFFALFRKVVEHIEANKKDREVLYGCKE